MRLRSTFAVLLALGACTAAKPTAAPPETTAAATTSVAASPPPPKGPFWLPINAPPAPDEVIYRLPVEGGELVGDRGGVRWLLPADGRAAQRAELRDDRRMRRLFRDGGGVWAVDEGGQVLHAETPLAAYEVKGKSPVGAEVVGTFSGGFSAASKTQVLYSSDLKAWRPLKRLEGRRPLQAHIDSKGRGVALFTPQAVGITDDGGQTWRTDPDQGTYVDELVPMPGRVFARPGGLRDGTMRVYRPGDTALAAAAGVKVASSHVRVGKVRHVLGMGFDAAREAARGGKPTRNDRLGELFDGHAVLVGDTLTVAHWEQRTSRRKLGEPATFPFTGETFGESCERDSAIAVCGESVARTCGGKVVEYREDREPTVIANLWARALAYTTKRQLLVQSGKGLYIVDRDGTRRLEADLPEQHFSANIVSSCRGRAWVLSSFKNILVRVDGDTATVIDVPESVHTDNSFLGLGEDDRPVFLVEGVGDDKGHFSIGTVGADDKWVERTLPFKPADVRARLGSLAQGRGMLVGEDGRGYVTTDGAKSWTPIALPLHYGKIPARLVCGSSGCELEGVAYSARWDALPASRGAVGSQMDPAPQPSPQPPVSLRLTCKDVPGAKDIPVSRASLLGPGVGTAIAGTFEMHVPIVNGKEAWREVKSGAEIRVDPGGKVRRRKTRSVRKPLDESVVHAFGRVAVQGFGGRWTIEPMTWEWSGAALGRGRTQKFSTNHEGPGANVGITLQTPTGLALVDRLTAEVLHLRSDLKSEKRAWSLPMLGPNYVPGHGTMVELPNKDWIVVGARHRERADANFAVSLMRVEPNGVAHHRRLAHDGGFVTLALHNGAALFVAEEVLEDGSTMLRSRPLGSDLTLGPPTDMRVMIEPSGEVVIPPPCDGPGSGPLVRYPLPPGLLTTDRYPNLVRESHSVQLRIGPTSVCSRRRVIGDVVVMGDGNGEGVGSDYIHPANGPSRQVLRRHLCTRAK